MDPTATYSISYHTMYIELLEWQGVFGLLGLLNILIIL